MESKIIHKTYKFRLKPDDDQKKQFAQIAGVCRLVWNLCLEQRVTIYSSSRKSLNSYNPLPEVTQLRREYDWIEDIPSQVLQQKVPDLDVAYRNFFEGCAGFPERKKKASRNFNKLKIKIVALHARIADTRRDHIHKATTSITKNHGLVVFEDLRVQAMSKSAKGDVDSPGRNIRQKAGLNRGILDVGWGEFRRQIEYKTAWAHGIAIAVAPQNTSRQCPVCGHTAKENRMTQADFICVNCGHADDADVNVAINILRAGHARLACGEIGAVRPLGEAGTLKAA